MESPYRGKGPLFVGVVLFGSKLPSADTAITSPFSLSLTLPSLCVVGKIYCKRRYSTYKAIITHVVIKGLKYIYVYFICHAEQSWSLNQKSAKHLLTTSLGKICFICPVWYNMDCTVDITKGLYDVCALGVTVVAIAVSKAINFNKANTTETSSYLDRTLY